MLNIGLDYFDYSNAKKDDPGQGDTTTGHWGSTRSKLTLGD